MNILITGSAHLSFGYDHSVLSRHTLTVCLDKSGIPYQMDDMRWDLILRLEEHAAEARRARGEDLAEYLHRDPTSLSSAQLRHILTQYGVAYPHYANKGDLSRLFTARFPRPGSSAKGKILFLTNHTERIAAEKEIIQPVNYADLTGNTTTWQTIDEDESRALMGLPPKSKTYIDLS